MNHSKLTLGFNRRLAAAKRRRTRREKMIEDALDALDGELRIARKTKDRTVAREVFISASHKYMASFSPAVRIA